MKYGKLSAILKAVMYRGNMVLFIHLPVLNQLESNNSIRIKTLMIIVQVTLEMKMIMLLIYLYNNGVWKKCFHINQNILQDI